MTTTIIIVSVLAYFLIGISTFCWGVRNILMTDVRHKLNDDNPLHWFDSLDGGDFLFCFAMCIFWPITLPITFLIAAIAIIARWLWTHLLVKIITKSIERELRKEKKTNN